MEPDRTVAARRAAAVAAHGRTAMAFRARSPALAWWDAGAQGGVAYAPVRGAWVAAGEPVTDPATLFSVADAFRAAAARDGCRACFFATEGGLAHAPGLARIRIGEQPFWDPARWDAHVATHRSLREQLRRARAKGVRVRELVDPAARAEAASGAGPLPALLARWVATRPMAPMRFVVAPEPFADAPARRLFVAERDRTPVALLSVVPMGPDGWLFEHLVRPPSAPNGTAEALVHVAMRTVAAEGARAVTLGLAPLSGRVAWWLRLARAISRPLFNFAGLAQFKRKLRPDAWRPIYLVFPRGDSSLRAMRDALRAFAGGSLLRFAADTLRRSPEWSLRALEWLLLPWTVALALVPTAPWFPSAGAHAAWVLFDVGLWVLLRFRRAGRRPRHTRLAAAVTLGDALLTAAQAVLWNLPRLRGAGDFTSIAFAVAAPAVAATMLWRAARRERFVHEGPRT